MPRRIEISERFAGGDASMYIEMLEVLAESIIVYSADGDVVFANRAAVRQLGYRSAEEIHGPVTILDRFSLEDDHGRSLAREDLPSIRVLGGAEQVAFTAEAVDRVTGEHRWFLLRSSALRDNDGRLGGAMTVTEDITAVKSAELRTEVLAESGRVLASSLDYEQTLHNVVETAVPALADFCSIDLLNQRGRLERVAAVHRDPARQRDVVELAAISSPDGDPEHPARRVLRSGNSELYSDLSDPALPGGNDDGYVEVHRAFGARSILVVPLRVPTRSIGVMTLATEVSQRRLDGEDLELAEQLGRRAAVAVENARLHTTLTRVAETLQEALLPPPLPEIEGWELGALYRPTETDLRIDVGGDFYELFEHEGDWFGIIGDVTGKGVAAASVTALMRHGAHVACRSEPDPSAILARLDETLADQQASPMATAICLRIRANQIAISSAGHPPAILVSAAGALREVPRADPMLGAFTDVERHEEELTLAVGDLLFMYTDGVTDTRGSTDRFGAERFAELLRSQAGQDPDTALAAIDQALTSFASGPLDDDVAVIALRRPPA